MEEKSLPPPPAPAPRPPTMTTTPSASQQSHQPPMLPPASAPFPGSRTPGWNDPPTVQYNPLSGGSGRSRLNLNKRVAFPLQGTVGAADTSASNKPTAIVQPNQSSMPPPMPASGGSGGAHPVAVVHPMPNVGATSASPAASRVPSIPAHVPHTVGPVIALPADAQEYTLPLLRSVVALVQESPNVRRDDIERRLGIIEQLWQSGNLSAALQEKIYRIAKAIEEHKVEDALELYANLVANHSSECAPWAIALRHLILALQRTEATSMAATTGQVPRPVPMDQEPNRSMVSSEPPPMSSTPNSGSRGFPVVKHL